jgi:hypothetical protein
MTPTRKDGARRLDSLSLKTARRLLRRINVAWFSSERTATNRIEGRVTASQIAAASAA